MKYAVIHVHVLAGDGYVEDVECIASFDTEENANQLLEYLNKQQVAKHWDRLFVVEIK